MKWITWLRAEWDRVAGFSLVGLGALFILFGYLGVRETPFVAEQMAYIASGGIGGLFCLGFGVGLLLTADLHDEWRKLDRLEAELRGDAVPEAEFDLVSISEDSPSPDSGSGSTPGWRRRESVPQTAGAGGALASALTHPVGGTRRALAIVSLILLLPLAIAGAGWRRASQTVDLDVAARGLGLAVVAAAVAVAVIALWALWMRTGVLRRRAHIARAVRRSIRPRLTVTSARESSHRDEYRVFVAAGHPRFHRAGCPARVAGGCPRPPRRCRRRPVGLRTLRHAMSDYLPFVLVGLVTGVGLRPGGSMGLVLTYTTSGVFNFAHGAVGMFATYVFYSLRVDAGLPTALAVAVAVLGVGPAAGLRHRPGAAPSPRRRVGQHVRGRLPRPARGAARAGRGHLRRGDPPGGPDLPYRHLPPAGSERRRRPDAGRGRRRGRRDPPGPLLQPDASRAADPGRRRRPQPHRARRDRAPGGSPAFRWMLGCSLGRPVRRPVRPLHPARLRAPHPAGRPGLRRRRRRRSAGPCR